MRLPSRIRGRYTGCYIRLFTKTVIHNIVDVYRYYTCGLGSYSSDDWLTTGAESASSASEKHVGFCRFPWSALILYQQPIYKHHVDNLYCAYVIDRYLHGHTCYLYEKQVFHVDFFTPNRVLLFIDSYILCAFIFTSIYSVDPSLCGHPPTLWGARGKPQSLVEHESKSNGNGFWKKIHCWTEIYPSLIPNCI